MGDFQAFRNNIRRVLAFQFLMIKFVCDYCENVKQADEVWINGVAAENVGTQAARCEVIIDPAWRYERAIVPFAVHFCSLECKDSYLAELFNQPASLLEVESVEVQPARQRRVVHAKKVPVGKPAQKRTRKSGPVRGR
jgi:hypothetical protein